MNAKVVAGWWTAIERRRLRDAYILNAVTRPPWEVDPMRSAFHRIMIVVDLMIEQKAVLIAYVAKVPDASKTPWIEFRQIILAKTIPRTSYTAARPGHLVERPPNIAIHARDGHMIIAASFIPQAGPMGDHWSIRTRHGIGKLFEDIRSLANTSRGSPA